VAYKVKYKLQTNIFRETMTMHQEQMMSQIGYTLISIMVLCVVAWHRESNYI